MSFCRVVAVFAAALVMFAGPVSGQGRTVAITVDDLPYAQGGPADPNQPAVANDRILNALARRHVPATGFVIQTSVAAVGVASGTAILRAWTTRGFDLGNHFYSHPDIDKLSVAEVEDEIVRGEATIAPLMREAGKKLRYLRFPYNHTGDTQEKHEAIAAFITQRGYRLAPCTVENADYLFNRAYVLLRSRHDDAAADSVRAAYLAFTSAQIDYFSALNKQVFGYEPPHIMLLHDNQLNADVLDDVLALFAERHYRFVSLADAESDAAYRTPETFVSAAGPMWGYRWAAERHVTVNGKLEPDPPAWVEQYAK